MKYELYLCLIFIVVSFYSFQSVTQFKWGKYNYFYQQWIDPNDKGFGLFEYVVSGSTSNSCVWRKLGGETYLVCTSYQYHDKKILYWVQFLWFNCFFIKKTLEKYEIIL
jgi:hypothetical protein